MNDVAAKPTPFYRRKPSRRTTGIAALLLAALVAVILLFDWNWLKGPLERLVQVQTGRTFNIDGDLDVELGRITSVRMDKLRFGNAPWSRKPTMASADRAQIDFELWPLLSRRQARIPWIRLSAPKVLLETGPKGKGNWVFGDQSGESTVQFRRIWIDDGRLQFLDAANKTDIDISVNSAKTGTSSTAPPVDIIGKGRWAGNAFELSGRAESPLALGDRAEPYRIDLRASAGRTTAHARGTLTDPFKFGDFDLRLALAGQNLEDLFPLIGVATPATPPYHFDGRLTREDNTWHYDDFNGMVGDSDLGGSTAVTVGRERPLLVANLVSKRLDFDDLAGFIGAPAQANGGEATNPELKAQAAALASNPHVLPDTPYNLTKLRSMDADVRLKAHRINAPTLPIDDMDAHLKLDAGRVATGTAEFRRGGRRHPLHHPHGCTRKNHPHERPDFRAESRPFQAVPRCETDPGRGGTHRRRYRPCRNRQLHRGDAGQRRRRYRTGHGQRADQQSVDGTCRHRYRRSP